MGTEGPMGYTPPQIRSAYTFYFVLSFFPPTSSSEVAFNIITYRSTSVFPMIPAYANIECTVHLTRSLCGFLVSLGMGVVVFVLLLYRKLNGHADVYLYIHILHTTLNIFRGYTSICGVLLPKIYAFKILIDVAVGFQIFCIDSNPHQGELRATDALHVCLQR